MPASGFQGWWRAQIDAPRNRPSGPPLCPCASCFNGTGCGSTSQKGQDLKHQMSSKPPRVLGSRESVASDLIPLCSDAASVGRFSLEG
ncbi:hypothetical protein F5Y14DRAFT_318378 [Nemania sp. NC0429]|nr:hypothetical protein F5Y14DRAFT_318378 [Nemania sp. NC0429]